MMSCICLRGPVQFIIEVNTQVFVLLHYILTVSTSCILLLAYFVKQFELPLRLEVPPAPCLSWFPSPLATSIFKKRKKRTLSHPVCKAYTSTNTFLNTPYFAFTTIILPFPPPEIHRTLVGVFLKKGAPPHHWLCLNDSKSFLPPIPSSLSQLNSHLHFLDH